MGINSHQALSHFRLSALLWLGLCLPACWAGWASASTSRAVPLEADLQGVYQQVYSNPREALASLRERPLEPDSSPARKAQYLWLKAEAEDYLTLSDQARKSLTKARQWLDRESQPWLYHRVLLTEASVLNARGHPHKALEAANQALAWAESQNDKKFINNALVVRGQIYNTLMDHLSALKDFQRAYEITKQAGSEDMAPGEIAGFVALVYEYRREPELAIPYFQESADYFRKQGNDMELSIALYGLGKAYKNTGNEELAQNLLRESIVRAEKVGDEQGIAYALVELGHMALASKDYPKARKNYQQALAIFEKSGNPFKLYDVTSSLARVAMGEGLLEQAESLLQKAATYLDENTSPIQFNNLKFMRADLLAKRGEYPAAFELLRAAARERQRFISEKSTKELHRLQVQFRLKDKQRENELLLEKARAAEQRDQMQKVLLASSLSVGGILLAWGLRSRQLRRRMECLANTDSLTGLPNRRVIMDKARHEKDHLRNQPVALALLDIDDFKDINDTYGHATGDDVLRELGRCARQALQDFDRKGSMGRVGGEEFLLVMPAVSLQEAREFLLRLAEAVREIPRRIGQPAVPLTLSVGLSLMQAEGPLEADYARVDRALYRAKSLGKNRIEIELAEGEKTARSAPGLSSASRAESPIG